MDEGGLSVLSPEFKPRERVLLFILGYCCIAVPIMVLGIFTLSGWTRNPVGSMLFLSGALIFVLGGSLTVIGNREVDETSFLWKDEKVVYKGTPELSHEKSYPFHLGKPSTIMGEVSGKAGPYEFVIADLFGSGQKLHALDELKPRIHMKGKRGIEKIKIGPLNLPPGDYVLRFEEFPQIVASFTITETIRMKPYESFYQLGLTLLEVGIPIFITGVVSLGYGTLVPT